MTAIRVVTGHEELENSGQVSHSDLDTYITGSTFLVVSGTGPLPPSGRRLVAGAGIIITDTGPSGDLIISAPGAGVSIQWNEVPVGTIDNNNTIFTLAYVPLPSASLMLYLNGQLLDQGIGCDFSLSGSTITTFFVPILNDKLVATYPK